MRDLKHLIFFEDLLQDANNALVQQACAQGKLALAYNCSYIPEVLLDVEGCFGIRLRAPRCTSPDLATYYMTNRSCPYSKSILERAFEGGYNFIDALLGQECCTTMNRTEQYFEYCKLIPKERFFVSCIDMPLKKSDWHAGYFRRQIEKKIIEPLSRVYGVEGLQRRPDPQPFYRARVMVAGSEIDDPEFTKLLESCGAFVVADRYCFGSIPGREEIVLEEGKDILQSIADSYLYHNQCPRTMGPEAIVGRKQFLFDLAKEYGAEGVILQNMKFCEYWGYERAQAAMWMQEGFALPDTLPVCQIERDYTIAAAGQLRTRFQAFVESLEIKRIQAGK